jgi:CRISPR-associated protein Cas1
MLMKLHNTLYVTTQGAYLAKEHDTVIVRVDKETKLQLPIHTIGSIVCYGNVSCSPFLLGFCGERGVTVSFLTEHGRFLARVEGPISGNVLLRRAQYRAADSQDLSSNVARLIVGAKVVNSRVSLQRYLRDNHEIANQKDVQEAVTHLASSLNALRHPLLVDNIRGLEGDASRAYFSVFDHLVLCQKGEFLFSGRSRRPPLDNVNCLLSFLYTLLVHDARGACETVGLDPAVGFLHRDRPGRPSLALDLIEELRPVLADRLALSLINRRQVEAKGFIKEAAGGVVMDDETRKIVLVAYQSRKREEIVHPYFGEKVSMGLVFDLQARLLARHLRGDLDAYPPFFWR